MKPQLPSHKLSEMRRPVFKHRPALALLIAFLIGMACANVWDIPLWVTLSSLLLISLVFACSFSRLFRPYRNAVALLLCSVLGMSLYSLSVYQYRSGELIEYAAKAKKARIVGVVSEIEQLRNGQLLIVEVQRVIEDSLDIPIRGIVAATLGEAHEDRDVPLPRAGDSITFLATLQPLRTERNPYAGSYDERLQYYYKAQAVAQLSSRFDYYLHPSSERSLVQHLEATSLSIRTRCEGILDRAINDRETAAFVKAVVLGVRSGLNEGITIDFKKAGLTHLLAISGFNIAVVSLLIAQVLLLLGIRRRTIRLPVTAISVGFYCFVVGLEPSVFRAFVMVELYILAQMIERKTDLANLAAATALVHLFINPMVIHDAGFQLSYAAVFGFALIQPELTRLFEPSKDGLRDRTWLEWLRHSLILSVSAFIATAPVLIFHFGRIPLVVLLANLFAIPLAAVITVLGFVLIPLGFVLPSIAAVYSAVLSWLVGGLYLGSEWLSAIGGNGAAIDLNVWALLLISALVLWIVRSNTRKRLFGRVAIASVSCIALASIVGISHTSILSEGKLSVVFVDVGQGDAAVIKTPSGKFFMFDFGLLSGSDSAFHARPYAPLLQTENAAQLEAGFVTHLHRDHYGALISAVKDAMIQKIYTIGDRTSDEAAYELDSAVRVQKIEVERLYAGNILDLDRNVKLYVLNPDSLDGHGAISNDRSLVLKLVYGKTSYLFLGDIEREGEQSIVDRFGDFLKSDVVKVAHHGSISSSTRELVRAAGSRYAIISCGRNNRFGHPHPVVVSRWMRSGAEVLRTDLDGAIIFESNGERVERVEWKEK